MSQSKNKKCPFFNRLAAAARRAAAPSLSLALILALSGPAWAATHTLRGFWGESPATATLIDFQPQDTFRALTNAYFVLTEAGRESQAEREARRTLNLLGGLSESGHTAALFVDQTLYLHRNAATQIVVDGSGLGIPYNNYAYFSENSLTIFNAQNLAGGVLLQGDGRTRALIDPSTLFVLNALEGQRIVLLADFVYVEGAHYWADSLIFDNRMFHGSVTDGEWSLFVERQSAADTFEGLSGGAVNIIDGIFSEGANDLNSDNAGLRYISRAASRLYGDTGAKQTARAMESIGQLGSVAGVQLTSFQISQTFTGLMLNNGSSPVTEAGGPALWAAPFYNYVDASGLKLGSLKSEFESQFSGSVIGAEIAPRENFRAGLAFAAGSGDTETTGSFPKTESDFDFWGLGLYAAFNQGAFTLTGDLNYTVASYEVKQRNPDIAMGGLKADVDTRAWSFGLTAKYTFTPLENLKIIPHLGAHYTNLRLDDYTVKSGVGNISRIEADKQNIWTFPVGLTFTGDLNKGGNWAVKPLADIGLIFAAGDKDGHSKARLADASYAGNFRTEVVDSVTFNGSLGLKAESAGGFNFKLGYNLNASENLTSHGFAATLGYAW